MQKIIEGLIASLPFLGTPLKLVFGILVMALFGVFDQEIRQGTGNGPAKKLALIAQINAKIDEPGDFDWPSWLPKQIQEFLVGGSIDLVVFLGNKTGFFKQSSAG